MKIKRIILITLLCLLIFVFTFFIVSCTDKLPDNSKGVEVSLIVLNEENKSIYEKTITTTKSSLYESLNEFDGLEVSSTSSFLGAYINSVSVGIVVENEFGKYFEEEIKLESSISARTYVAVYHDINNILYKDLGGYSDNLTYNDNTYFYSGVGINILPLYDKSSYILKLASY